MIDFHRLESGIDSLRQTFQIATPYPFLCLDGVIDDDLLSVACEAWPDDSAEWNVSQRNKRSMREVPQAFAGLFSEFISWRFVRWLADLSGVDDLEADPLLSGGGLHETSVGGHLPLHLDFNRLGPLYRRMNVLLFLNRNWKPEWNGNLELVDHPKRPTIRREIMPTFNRLVIAESSDRSWHGQPHLLNTPDGRTRRSLAVYYYSAVPHATYREQHSTLYQRNRKQIRREQAELEGRK